MELLEATVATHICEEREGFLEENANQEKLTHFLANVFSIFLQIKRKLG
jgi:hypothetical protein